jgi:hypothetical protein
MDGSVVVGALWLLAAALLAAACAVLVRRRRPGVRLQMLGLRVGRAVDGAIAELGRLAVAAIVTAAGLAFTVGCCWVLGRVAHHLEPRVDRPVFGYFQTHQVGWWRHLASVVTQMGNGRETQVATVVAAVVFAALWRRGRWWAPAVTLIAGLVLERFLAQILREVVHRGHPPTTLGTWPSGGCARLVIVVGLVIFLWRRWRGLPTGRAAAWWWAALFVLANVEAYTRVVLSKHWLTDTVGGVVFGGMVLATMMAGFAVLEREADPGDVAETHADRAPRGGQVVGSPASF